MEVYNPYLRHQAVRWPAGATSRAPIPGVPAVTVVGSNAADINEAGWIVGHYGLNAFVWKNGADPATVLDPR